MPDDELSDLEFPTAQWLKRVRDARLSCEECAAKANQINQLAQQRQKLDAKVLSSDTEPAERDRSRRASQKIEAKIRRLMGPWNEIERRARALAQDLLDVVGILPPGDELVRQIENSIFVQEAQRRLRLNMGRSAKGLRMLEELLQRRLNKARAAAETAQEDQAVRKRGRGRPPSHDITKVNEAVEALKAGKPWTEVARILYGRCSKEDVQNAQSYLSAHLKKHGSSLRKLRQQSRVNSQ